MLREAIKCKSSPSKRNAFAYRLPQRETALRTIVSNTGCTSVGEARITRRISAVAACCWRTSSRSRLRRSNCSAEWSVDAGAVGALRTLDLIVRRPCCPLPPRRCMSPASGGSRRCSILGKYSLSRHGRMSALGHKRTYAPQQAMSALPPIATSIASFHEGGLLGVEGRTKAPKTAGGNR
jgi:hypothetical protein